MFMEKEVAVAPSISPAPVPNNNKKIPGKLGDTGTLTSRGAATAVAVKPATTSAMASPPKTAITVAEKSQPESISWVSWVAVGIAAVCTLAMGTILPFWFIPLAQQAALMMFK